MTKHKHLKERIRARMAKTGESYTAARRRVVATRQDDEPATGDYRLRGGTHPDTAALANVLANAGVTSNGSPLSEAAFLGIGGGLGAGYILWQFTGHHPIVTLGFRNQWQYPDRWLVKTCRRLGIEPSIHETSGHVTAMRTLREALQAPGPKPLVWIDAQEVGYWHLPDRFSGLAGYPVVVYGESDGRFFVDDRNTSSLSVDEATMRAARGRVPSYRNRLVTLDAPDEIPEGVVAGAVLDGLHDQVRHLQSESDSFSLPAWRKWSRMLTEPRHKKGWVNVFADQAGLFGVLLTIYESVESSGFGGGSLRELYAEFLDYAAGVTDRPALSKVADAYRQLDRAWAGVAERAAPLDVGPFGRARELIDSLHEQVLEGGDAGRLDAGRTAGALWSLRDSGDDRPLFTDDAFADFLEDLGRDLLSLYEGERAAVAELRRIAR